MKVLVSMRPGEKDSVALRRARQIAKAEDTDLVLFSAVYNEHLPGARFGIDDEMKQMRQALVERERETLRETVANCSSQFRSVSSVVRWQYPTSEAIVQAAAECEADLIVLAAGEHSAIARLFLNNTDWEVMRAARVPVLVVRSSDFVPYKRVLVAIDPTHPEEQSQSLDHRLVGAARLLGDPGESELFIAHIYPSVEALVVGDYVPNAQEVAEIQAHHRMAADAFARDEAIDTDHVILRSGIPRWQIPEIAREYSIDAVVMGSISRSFLSRLLIGKTTETVLSHLPCDALVLSAHTA